MKVEIQDKGLLIVPETEFERQFLQLNYSESRDYVVFLKKGFSPAEVVGLKINQPAK